MFTPDEVEAVVVGLRMAQAFAGQRLSDASVTALDKVILALPKHRRAEVERPPIFAPAVQAVLRLTYADDSQKTTERAVQPLALNFWGKVWTLAAWCRLRQDFRNFRLDRVHTCIRSGDLFIDEPGKTLADFLRTIRAR